MVEGESYDKGVRKDQNTGSYGDFKPRHIKSNGMRYPNDVLGIDIEDDFIYVKTAEAEGKVYHPTQKTVELGKYLIRIFTNPGDIVLDNACGSASFLVAATIEKKRYIGIEKNTNAMLHKEKETDYIEVCKERLTQILQKQSIKDIYEKKWTRLGGAIN